MKKAQYKKALVNDAIKQTKNILTSDGYQNVFARLGISGDNLSSGSTYGFDGFITRNRLMLDAMYRTSWVVGAVVDTKADDMTRAGISINSDLTPEDTNKIQKKMVSLNVWRNLSDVIKWGRLYGGAVAILLIEGQKMDQPLNINAVGKDAFKGLLVLDRWLLNPSMGNLVQDFGPDFGLPKYYDVIPTSAVLPQMKIHHTRVLRFGGIELPYLWKQAENLWSESVIERMFDRLIAFDSTTQGAAQLVFKAHLRTIQIEGLRDILAAGGVMEAALIKQFTYIRQMQSNEGITLLDSKDVFNSHQYTFGGLSDVLLQFGQQLSGATQIPLVRLFGQSPTGMNSTGESDLRTYYDGVNKDQVSQLTEPLLTILRVMCMSILSKPLPEDASILFNSLWQMDDKEKVDLAKNIGDGVAGLVNAGIMKKSIALKELRQSSKITGIYTNITEEDIKDAEENLDDLVLPGEDDDLNFGDPGKKDLEKKVTDSFPSHDFAPVVEAIQQSTLDTEAIVAGLEKKIDVLAALPKTQDRQPIVIHQAPITVNAEFKAAEKKQSQTFESLDSKGNVVRTLRVKE